MAAGGQNLGAASGRLTIDTSDLSNVEARAQGVAANVERSFGRINAAASQTQASIRQLAGAFGVGLGVAQVTRFALAGERLATSYLRQSVAAVDLAGSQEKLNELLEAYERATGGAIDRATALADVTSLLSQGFADNAEELEKFLIGVRGASVAMGRSQEFIITRLQLELLNQTGQRLNEIGLSMGAVRARAEELRETNRGLTREQAYQQAVLGELADRYGAVAQSNEAAATGTEELNKTLRDLRLEFGLLTRGPINTAALAMTNWLRNARRDLGFVTDAVNTLGNAIRSLPQIPGILGEAAAGGVTVTVVPFAGGGIVGGFGGGGGGGGFTNRNLAARFSPEQEALITEWEERRREIEADYQEQRLDATRQFEEQRTSTIRQYEKTIAREAEDFARQRLRAEQQFADQIADIRADAMRREAQQIAELERRIGNLRADATERIADWEEDHAERIAELRTEGNRRLVELEEDFQRERVRAAEQHRETLLGAAARLDAAAVLAEQRRFAQSEREAREDHTRRMARERENLDERIRQEQEAHEERVREEQESLEKRIRQEREAHERRIQEAREADERRIADMRADFEERKRIEDEDYAIRLARMQQDHEDQLAEMNRQQVLRLQQIREHAEDERTQLDTEFRKHLVALGIHIDAWIDENDRLTDAAIENFDRWFRHMELRAAGLRGLGAIEGGSHPSEADPYVNMEPVVRTSTTTSRTTAITVAPGAITVLEAQRPGQTALEVENALISILGRLQ